MQAFIILTFSTFVTVNSQFPNPYFGNFQNQQQYNPISNGFPQFQQFNNQFNQQFRPPYNQQFNNQNNQQYRPPNNQQFNYQNNQQFRPPNNQQFNVNRPTVIPNRGDQSSSSNLRISEQKCKEYQLAGQQDEELEIGGSLSSRPQSLTSEACQLSEGLVVGGENAKVGEFPHMVAIGFRNLDNELSFDCGGSLISERFVLTAAHCKYSGRTEASVVRVGDLNLKVKELGLPELDVPIASFIIHERYDGANKKNDIAVVRLARNVEFNKFVRPACLMTKNSFPQIRGTASGWGFTDSLFPQRADHLQKVELPLIGYNDCDKNYNKGSKFNLDSTQLCAGDNGKDTCGGDSGGPLQILANENSCTYTIVGVTSFGNKYCGGANSAGIYTKVSAYIDWIEQKVWRS